MIYSLNPHFSAHNVSKLIHMCYKWWGDIWDLLPKMRFAVARCLCNNLLMKHNNNNNNKNNNNICLKSNIQTSSVDYCASLGPSISFTSIL